MCFDGFFRPEVIVIGCAQWFNMFLFDERIFVSWPRKNDEEIEEDSQIVGNFYFSLHMSAIYIVRTHKWDGAQAKAYAYVQEGEGLSIHVRTQIKY